MNLFFKRNTVLLLLISLSMLLLSCNQKSSSAIVNFYMYPNPYVSKAGSEATFVIEFDKVYDGGIKLLVEDSESVSVYEYSKEFTSKESLNFKWAVKNYNGFMLAPGLYYATVRLYGTNTGERKFLILVS